MLGIGTGCLGLSVKEFYEMRPVHFFLRLFEYNRSEEQKYRANAELIRLQTATLVNLQVKKSDRVKPNQLWHFPWDNENDVEQHLKALPADEFNRRYKEFINGRKNPQPET